MAQKGNGVAGKRWSEMSDAERLSANARRGLERVREVLELSLDEGNPRVMGIIVSAALSMIATKVKVDELSLSAREGRLEAERAVALRNLVQRLPERFRPVATGGDGEPEASQDQSLAARSAEQDGPFG